jgi:K319L-like, PKD domain
MRARSLWSVVALSSLLVGCGGGGGGGGGSATPPQSNSPPTATIMASGQVTTGANADLLTSVGASVSLSGGASTDADGDILTFRWTLTERPAASQLVLTSPTSSIIDVTPDALGRYTVSLRVTDARGAFADKNVTLVVDNTAPTPRVLISATFQATPITQPTKDVSVGSVLILDASNSTDPEGQPITATFSLLDRPASSTATLTVQGKTARMVADVPGVFRIAARGQDPAGAYFETIHVFDAVNRAPDPIVIASVTAEAVNSGSNAIAASVGYTVVLDGSRSSDPEAGTLTGAWQLLSRPAGSAAQLSQTAGTSTQFSIDALGTYLVRLTVTDPQGAAAYYTTQINATNRRPIADIASNATPVALPSGPTVRVPINTELTLRGTGSRDADGDVLTYLWSLVLRPAGSIAGLSAPNSEVTRFTPDSGGNYIVRLRVVDPAGAYSERDFVIAVGNFEPAAVVDKYRVTAVVGTSVSASAALSFDDDGDPLLYTWSIDAHPGTSTATIGTPHAASVSFTPDVPGLYALTVEVSDGGATSLAHVIVKALADIADSVSLPFVPLDMLYSKGLDVAVTLTANPNAFRTVDPYTGSSRAVALPAAAKSFKLSPNGRLAAVLHEGSVSLLDVGTATLIQSSATLGSQTDVFPLDDGTAYLIGHSGGQWVDEPIVAMNLRTGQRLTLPPYFNNGAFFYGTQKGVLANRKNRVLFMAYGLSPADISYFSFDPGNHNVLNAGDSPYHGDYVLGSEFYLSGNQDLLFTSSGTYFNTETLRYAGTLFTSGSMLHMTHSSTADEALVLQRTSSGSYPYTSVYQSFYRRFWGALFYEDANIPLPLVDGEQSYGLKIFHSANDDHVVLVQTGSAEELAPQAEYHIIVR